MDHDSEGADVLRVTDDGVMVEKGFEAEEFPVPAIKFVISSDRDEPVTVRIEDDIPPDFPMDGVGFHPDYHSDQWTAYKDHRVEFAGDVDPGETVLTVYGIRVGSMAEVEPFLTDPAIEEVIPVSEDLVGSSDDAVEDARLMADIVTEDSSQLVRDFLAGKTDTLPGLDDMMGDPTAAGGQDAGEQPAADTGDTRSEPGSDGEPTPATPDNEEPITPAAPGTGATPGEEATDVTDASGETTATDVPTDTDIDMPETPDDEHATEESPADDDIDDLSMGDEDAEALLGGTDEEPGSAGDADRQPDEPPAGASEDDIADAIDLGLDDADDMVVAESDVEPDEPAGGVSVDLGGDLDEGPRSMDGEMEDITADDVGVDVGGAPDLGGEAESDTDVEADDGDSPDPEGDIEDDIEFDDVAAGGIGDQSSAPEADGEPADDSVAADVDGDPSADEAIPDTDPTDVKDADESPEDTAEPEEIGGPERETSGDPDTEPDVPSDQSEADDIEAEPEQDESEEEPADSSQVSAAAGPSAGVNETESIASALAAEIRAGDVHDEDLDELRAALGATGVDDSAESGSLQARVEHLDARMSELSAYTNALEEFLDEHGGGQELIDRLDETVDRLDSELESIRDTADGHDDRLESVSGSVDELETTVEDVRSTAEGTQSAVDELQSDVETIQEQVEAINEIATDVEAMDERLSDIEEWRNQLGEMFK